MSDEPTPIHDSIRIPWDAYKRMDYEKAWDARVKAAMSR